MFHSRIAGTGSYLPEKVLSNFDLEKLVDTSDQWIRERVGIEKRHLAAPGEKTSDLAYNASIKALAAARLQPSDLDMIIVCTISGDQIMPATACYLQSKLGCRSIPAFDLAAACSGFVYGLSVGDQFIRTGAQRNVLVVGAEIFHHFVDYKDRATCILFGDGAGAFILSRAETGDDNIIISSHLQADGTLAELLTIAGGGSRSPHWAEAYSAGELFIKMNGREIFKHAVRTMSQSAKRCLDENQISMDELHWFVPHQANSRIMTSIADHLGLAQEKVISVVHEIGNNSSATIPIAFDMAVSDGRIQRGQTVLLAAFGAGLTSGSVLLRY